MLEIVKKDFWDEVERGIVPLGGHTPIGQCRIDESRAEWVFGIGYRSFEEQILGLVRQYVYLVEKSRGEAKRGGIWERY